MEWFLSLFILHDTLVVSLLVVGITIVVVMLLLFSQKTPESVVKSELGGSENVEGALRRVLGEQRWLQTEAVGAGSPGLDSQKVDQLEMEVLEKDRTIAELNKQLTQAGTSGDYSGGETDSDLLARLAELEARLEEYEIIEDDIADLSLYKTENQKLKDEIASLKNRLGGSTSEPIAESESEPSQPTAAEPTRIVPSDDGDAVDGADLVAEFEKVVNSQSQIETDESSSRVTVKPDDLPGTVVMVDEPTGTETVEMASSENVSGETHIVEDDLPLHPKLKHINPDSKEEAEVFISELKNLKAINKKTEDS